MGRCYAGIEINPEYIDVSLNRLTQIQIQLPDIVEEQEIYQTS